MAFSDAADICYRDDKDTDSAYAVAGLDDGSFFDLNFNPGQETILESSDTSIGSVLFDDTDLCGSSMSSYDLADASVPSSISHVLALRLKPPCSGSQSQQQHQEQQQYSRQQRPANSISAASNTLVRKDQHIKSASGPVSASQRLVHSLRPDGVSISHEDLLLLEGIRPAAAVTPRIGELPDPKTPPTTPSTSRSHQTTPKTPRTPREREARVCKARDISKLPILKSMQPSNYYVEPLCATASHWCKERHPEERRADIRNRSAEDMPISSPLPARNGQQARPGNLSIPHKSQHRQDQHQALAHRYQQQQQHQYSYMLDSPTSTPATIPRNAPSFVPLAFRNLAPHGYADYDYEQEALVSPLSPWDDGQGAGLTFSPVSPLFGEDMYWNAPDVVPTAQMQPTYETPEYDEPVETILLSAHVGYGRAHAPCGLMIDLGEDPVSPLNHPIQTCQLGLVSDREGGHDARVQPREEQAGMDAQHDTECACCDGIGNKSAVRNPALPTSNGATKSRRKGSSRRKTSADAGTAAFRHGHVSSSRLPSSQQPARDILHDQQAAKTREGRVPSDPGPLGTAITAKPSAGKKLDGGTGKPSTKGSPGETFVNFTPSDSRKILTGVAPSGSSKTKARREKEATERRRKLSEAAQRAVREAGGDWERVAGELVEV